MMETLKIMLGRMKANFVGFWQSVTLREQIAFLVAGTAIALFLLYVGLIRPLDMSLEKSRMSLATEQARFERITGLLSRAGNQSEVVSHGDKPLRAALTETAKRVNIGLSMIQPGDDGSVTVRINKTSSASLMRWLSALQSEQGLQADEVLIQKNMNEKSLNVRAVFGRK